MEFITLKKLVNQDPDIANFIKGPNTEAFINDYDEEYDLEALRQEIDNLEAEHPYIIKLKDLEIGCLSQIALSAVIIFIYANLWGFWTAILMWLIIYLGIPTISLIFLTNDVLYSKEINSLINEYEAARQADLNKK